MKIVNGAATKGTPGAWSAINQEWLYLRPPWTTKKKKFLDLLIRIRIKIKTVYPEGKVLSTRYGCNIEITLDHQEEEISGFADKDKDKKEKNASR